MGEEAKQEQEQPKAESPEKTEEVKTEDAKAEDTNKSPPPVILFVDLHCVGCAKKIERSIVRIKGVEGVVIDMARNQVMIRGGGLDPQAVCDRITKKTRRMAKVLSPLPPLAENEQPPTSALADPPVNGPATKTVELNMNMHCEACAGQLERKILKMEGVEKVETEVGSGKVTVTGIMGADKLVDYVYRQTKKKAQIVPQPEPEPESKNQEGGEQNKKEDGEEKPAEDAGQGKEEEKDKKDDVAKEEGEKNVGLNAEDVVKRMVNYYQYQQPLYVMERMPPPPQLFSDENPNACSIS